MQSLTPDFFSNEFFEKMVDVYRFASHRITEDQRKYAMLPFSELAIVSINLHRLLSCARTDVREDSILHIIPGKDGYSQLVFLMNDLKKRCQLVKYAQLNGNNREERVCRELGIRYMKVKDDIFQIIETHTLFVPSEITQFLSDSIITELMIHVEFLKTYTVTSYVESDERRCFAICETYRTEFYRLLHEVKKIAYLLSKRDWGQAFDSLCEMLDESKCLTEKFSSDFEHKFDSCVKEKYQADYDDITKAVSDFFNVLSKQIQLNKYYK